jgi:pyruvate dehydrogenase E2 component (dihydrolipoamide acetyltransferase)
MPDDGARTTIAGPGRLVRPTRMRAAIARGMSASKRDAPHFYVSTDIIVETLLAGARREGGTPGKPRVTVTALLIHRLAAALRAHPSFNALATDEGFVQVDAINIGVAIALDEGLIAPALLDCAGAEPVAIAAALEDLVARARKGRLRAAELTGATFTLSNLGMFSVTQFAAILPPLQVGILAVGRATPRPVVIDGKILIRNVMSATLSADHRAVDGAGAGQFLTTFKGLVEGGSDAPSGGPP